MKWILVVSMNCFLHVCCKSIVFYSCTKPPIHRSAEIAPSSSLKGWSGNPQSPGG